MLAKRTWQNLNTRFSSSDRVGLGYILSNNDPLPDNIDKIEFGGTERQGKDINLVFNVTKTDEPPATVRLPVSFLKEQYPKYRNNKLRDDKLSEAITQGYEHLAKLRDKIESLNLSKGDIASVFGMPALSEVSDFLDSADIRNIPDARSMVKIFTRDCGQPTHARPLLRK